MIWARRRLHSYNGIDAYLNTEKSFRSRKRGGVYMKRFLLVAALICLTACENQRFGKTEIGALGGAAAGAGLGAIIGHETGHTGGGIAIGSAVGALGGGLVGSQLDSTDRQLDERERELADRDRRIRENEKLLAELRSRGVDVHPSARGIVVNLPDVLFKFNRADLTSTARQTTREVSDALQQFPGRRISVEGHTDSVGSISYNYELSEDRAKSVARELTHNGIPSRFVTVRGYGESQPIASNKTEDGRRRNRRVEVIIENRRR